jgi:hypothetical protein
MLEQNALASTPTLQLLKKTMQLQVKPEHRTSLMIELARQ